MTLVRELSNAGYKQDAASGDIEFCLLGWSQGFPGSNIGIGRGQRKCPSAIIAMSPLHRGRSPVRPEPGAVHRSDAYRWVGMAVYGYVRVSTDRQVPLGAAVNVVD